MTFRSRLAARTTPILQAGVALVLVYGILVWNPGIIVNASLGLAVVFLPAVLARNYELRLGPELVGIVSLSVFLHAIGMVGLYERAWWWDHLTHVLSATVVASVSYAAVSAVDNYREDIYLPPTFLVLFLLTSTLAFGVLWELLEFLARALGVLVGAAPVLVIYGVEDVALDLVFDAIGGLLVATIGYRRLDPDVTTLTEWLYALRD